jgi:hypothetical protein
MLTNCATKFFFADIFKVLKKGFCHEQILMNHTVYQGLKTNILTTIPTKREKKVHKLPIILKKLIFFPNSKIRRKKHIIVSKASKKIQIFS